MHPKFVRIFVYFELSVYLKFFHPHWKCPDPFERESVIILRGWLKIFIESGYILAKETKLTVRVLERDKLFLLSFASKYNFPVNFKWFSWIFNWLWVNSKNLKEQAVFTLFLKRIFCPVFANMVNPVRSSKALSSNNSLFNMH